MKYYVLLDFSVYVYTKTLCTTTFLPVTKCCDSHVRVPSYTYMRALKYIHVDELCDYDLNQIQTHTLYVTHILKA